MYGVTQPLPGERAVPLVRPENGRSYAVIDGDGLINLRQRSGLKVQHADLGGDLWRLVTSEEGVALVARKVIIDVNEGREDVPLLYGLLYDRLADDNLPRQVDTNLIAESDVVFLSRLEGGEVFFGGMSGGASSSIPILNWSAGFQWTRENKKFNETFTIERFNKGFGRAYNALLNHLHLGPIIAYSYGSPNLTGASAVGTGILDHTRNTITDGLQDAALDNRPATIMLAATADKYTIEQSIALRRDQNGNEFPAVSEIQAIIYYDGWTAAVNGRNYSYPGVTAGTAYLIRPKAKLVEAIATENGKDLIIVTGNPDVSRGIEAQMVGHTYRGVYANLAESVQKLTLPSS